MAVQFYLPTNKLLPTLELGFLNIVFCDFFIYFGYRSFEICEYFLSIQFFNFLFCKLCFWGGILNPSRPRSNFRSVILFLSYGMVYSVD